MRARMTTIEGQKRHGGAVEREETMFRRPTARRQGSREVHEQMVTAERERSVDYDDCMLFYCRSGVEIAGWGNLQLHCLSCLETFGILYCYPGLYNNMQMVTLSS